MIDTIVERVLTLMPRLLGIGLGSLQCFVALSGVSTQTITTFFCNLHTPFNLLVTDEPSADYLKTSASVTGGMTVRITCAGLVFLFTFMMALQYLDNWTTVVRYLVSVLAITVSVRITWQFGHELCQRRSRQGRTIRFNRLGR